MLAPSSPTKMSGGSAVCANIVTDLMGQLDTCSVSHPVAEGCPQQASNPGNRSYSRESIEALPGKHVVACSDSLLAGSGPAGIVLPGSS